MKLLESLRHPERLLVDDFVRPLLFSVGAQPSGYVRCWVLPEFTMFAGRCWGLHRLTWCALIGPIPEGWHVHHKNDDTYDNLLENLEPMSPREHLRMTHLGKKKPAVSLRMSGVPKSEEHRARISQSLRQYFDARY